MYDVHCASTLALTCVCMLQVIHIPTGGEAGGASSTGPSARSQPQRQTNLNSARPKPATAKPAKPVPKKMERKVAPSGASEGKQGAKGGPAWK